MMLANPGYVCTNNSLTSAEGAAVSMERVLDLTIMGSPISVSGHVTQEAKMLRFDVPDMTCGGCARGVTRAVQKVDPLAKVEADPPTRLVQVETLADPNSLLVALTQAGFPSTLQSSPEA